MSIENALVTRQDSITYNPQAQDPYFEDAPEDTSTVTVLPSSALDPAPGFVDTTMPSGWSGLATSTVVVANPSLSRAETAR